MKRPRGVTVIAVFDFICSVGAFVWGVYFLILDKAALLKDARVLLGIVVFDGSIVSLILAVGLWQMKNWARIAAVAYSLLNILSGIAAIFLPFPNLLAFSRLVASLINLYINLGIAWYLMTPRVRRAFAAPAAVSLADRPTFVG